MADLKNDDDERHPPLMKRDGALPNRIFLASPSFKHFMLHYPPLIGDDGGFTKDSIVRRLPNIVTETLSSNSGLLNASAISSLKELAADLASDGIVIPLLPNQPEEAWLTEYTKTYIGKRFCEIPWFFLEIYFYKRILDVTREQQIDDPFFKMKEDALTGAKDAFLTTVLPLCYHGLFKDGEKVSAPLLKAAMYRSLWGNRADLSLSAGVVLSSEGNADSDSACLLADDSDKAVEHLLSDGEKNEVVIILDNCGLELLSDLVFSLVLLKSNPSLKITLMSKSSPVFVSDVVLMRDVESHIKFIEHLGNTMSETDQGKISTVCAKVLREHISSGRLSVESDEFFTSPLPGWHMPERLRMRLSRNNRLTISKGDANYRRLLGDLHWPHQKIFSDVMSYFPTSILALRTTKAGVIVGISQEIEDKISSLHDDWLVSGKFGLIQLRLIMDS